jgi:putative transposase
VIGELRHAHAISLLLEVSNLPRSTYYYYTNQRTAADKCSAIKEQITAINTENKGRYGYRRVTDELHNRGYVINHKTVQRLMKELGIICRVRMKKYHSYKGEVGKVAPDLLERNFEAKNRIRSGLLMLQSSACSGRSCIYHRY